SRPPSSTARPLPLWLRFDGNRQRPGVHVRSCGPPEAVGADGAAARAAVVVSRGSVVIAQIGGADLQNRLSTMRCPKLLAALDALIELFDQRLHGSTRARQAFATVEGVIHAALV